MPPPPIVDELRRLTAFWPSLAPSSAPAPRAMLEAAAARLGVDGARYSDVFEPSVSVDAGRLDVQRFSYSFPGFRRDPADAERAMCALLDPLAPSVAAACRQLARAARHPAVDHPLVGYAGEGGRGSGGWRAKLYLQFRAGAEAQAAAASLVRRLLGCRLDPARLDGELHMLGMDVGPSGLRGAKLYCERTSIAADALSSLLGFVVPHPVARPLFVHRLDGPDDELAREPSEIDWPLGADGWTLRDLLPLPALRDTAGATETIARLDTAFSLRWRRVSVSLPPARKVNLYYALAG